MSLEKMTITACDIEENGNISVNSDTISVQINPTSFFHEHGIVYSKRKPIGTIGRELKYSETSEEKVSFEIIFDGTVIISEDSSFISVDESIKILKNIIYNYNGSEHQPRPVNIAWGGFSMYCRLTSLLIDYTMFSSTGTPLRAKVKLAFSSYMSKEEEAKKANRSSPDLTHIIKVKVGDTLPLLCYKIYRSPSYYLEVARINGLNSLQYLRPGIELKFPPLR